MAKCKNCINLQNHWCDMVTDSPDENAERECCTYERMTNADKIRSMSNEELAEFLCKVKSDYQWADHEFPSEEEYGEWVEWLQQEVEQQVVSKLQAN